MARHTDGLREDLLRGVRWGVILMLAALLSIAVYRVASFSPAVASPTPAAAETPVEAPAVIVEPAIPETETAAPEPLIRVADPVRPVQRSRVAQPVPEPPAPARSPAKSFAAGPAPAPAVATPEVSAALPEFAEVPEAPVVNLPPAGPLAPPPASGDREGSRAGRVVRSVGRLFRLGRKDESKQK